MLHPREFSKLVLYYAHEIMLDVATPGKVAHDRAVTNAKLMKDTVENMVSYWNYDLKELYSEIYKEHEDSQVMKKEQGKKRR